MGSDHSGKEIHSREGGPALSESETAKLFRALNPGQRLLPQKNAGQRKLLLDHESILLWIVYCTNLTA